jgi:transposase
LGPDGRRGCREGVRRTTGGQPRRARHAGPGIISEATRLRTYSAELKDSLVAKMLPPNNVRVPQLVRETGIPRDTLYGWRRQAVGRGGCGGNPGVPRGELEQRGEVRGGGGDRPPQRAGAGRILPAQGAVCGADRRLARDLPPGQRRPADQGRTGPAARRTRAGPIPDPGAAAQRPRPGRGCSLAGTPKKLRALWEEPADVPFPRSGGSR